MKRKWLFLIVIALFACKKEEKRTDYSLYAKMDKVEFTENKLRPRKKMMVPFTFNQVYDPFKQTKKGVNKKAGYEKQGGDFLKMSVLDTIITSMNATGRNSLKEKRTQAFPVIIENTHKKETTSIPLHRGCARIVQEAMNDKNEWIEIEIMTKEKIGDFYYEISPYHYLYTKIPIYEGNETTTFRLKMELEDTTIFSNSYISTIQKWMIR